MITRYGILINYYNNNFNHSNINDGNAANVGRMVLDDNDTVGNSINLVYGNDGSRTVRIWDAQLNQFTDSKMVIKIHWN